MMTAGSVTYAAGPMPASAGQAVTIAAAVSTTPATLPMLNVEPAIYTAEPGRPADILASPSPQVPAASLAALVERHDDDLGNLDEQTRCLATAVFYEARAESQAGKLAVARVIVNRAGSGRFRSSLCGVVTQPGQFSFVRHGQIPAVSAGGAQWADSVAIARIAAADAWQSQAEGALYFHASRVSPGWGRQRLARIDNHVFYR